MLFLTYSYGQNMSEKDKNQPSFLDRTEFSIGYTGNIFWNNGISFGAEYLWKNIDKIKERKGSQFVNTHQFLFNGNLGVTTNFATKTDTGGFVNFGMTWRRTNRKGKQISIAVNPLGYYRSFLPETYEVNGDNINRVSLAGRGYYSPSLSIGIGKQRKEKVRSASYFNKELS